VVVDLDDEDSMYDQVRAWGVPIIVADARRPEILEQAGLHTASAIVPVSGDDLVNLAIATAARGLRPDMRVVLRTFDDALAANLQTGFDIHRAYSTSALAAPAFAAAAVHAPVDYAFSYETEYDGEISQALVTITKFTLVEGSKLAGYTVDQLEDEFGVNVIAVRAKGFEVHPAGARVLNVGEGFVVSATPEALDQLAKYVPPTREMRRYLQGRWPILT
jgi:Trk K+ transport system NAD-binding subunit